MIFWTWRSYFIRWQIFENKVWCPVSKKRTKYFHFLLSRAYPIDRLDWALFSVAILFHHLFPLLEKVEIRVFILPCNFPAVLSFLRAGAGNPPFPAGRGVHPWFYALYATLLTTYSTILRGCHYIRDSRICALHGDEKKLNCSANSNQNLISKENFYEQQQQKSASRLLLKSQSQAWVINAALKSL